MLDFDSTASAIAELRQAREALLAATTAYADTRERLRTTAGLETAEKTDTNDILVPFLRSMQEHAESVCHVGGGDVSLDLEAFEAHLSKTCGFKRPATGRYEPFQPLFSLLSAGLLDGSVTPHECWESMVSVLRSDEIVSAALTTTARQLGHLFGCSLSGKVRRTSGKISVRHSVTVDSIWPDRVCWRSVEDFQKAVSGLIAVAEWAGLDDVALRLPSARGLIDTHQQIESRAQYPLGGGVVLITFKSSFEYRLPEAFGIALGQFVHKYAADTMEHYAAA